MTTSQLMLPALPKSWNAGETSRVHAKLSEFADQTIAQVGQRVQAFLQFQHSDPQTLDCQDHLTLAEQQDKIGVAAGGSTVVHGSEYDDDEDEDEELLDMDPKDWKDQDHYAVLGLSKLRYRATAEDIKLQFHRKVLRHHPDKKAAGGNIHDDRFFKCIQKAHEILTDPVKRMQFDSVDPELDDSLPPAKLKGDFFDVYGKVFEREARFSKEQPVPVLGDLDAPRAQVEAFYEFWYGINSWRTFEYLDKEDAEGADNRDNKRWMDKKNRAERARRKNEDNARLRQLVDQAIKADPRMIKFRQEDREARLARKNKGKGKNTKAAAPSKEAQEAKKKAEEESKKLAQQKEVEAKAARQQEKKAKEEMRRAIRTHKNTIKELSSSNNYFVDPATRVSATLMETQLNKLDKLFSKHKTPEAMAELADKLNAAAKEGQLPQVFDTLTADC
ncbi:Zuotin [Dispira parvispora]|uniref:Zuotin n=1 Tax=Dispira parvispora TaxID=1520584 RepID=A0A9W8E3I7_9FUNG|nr:Zuotin [Dispira parvispora]